MEQKNKKETKENNPNTQSKKIKSIGVLTSGGDAPGMNAAIRAVVRTGNYYGFDMFGIMRGYSGLVENEIIPMSTKSVANIIQRGGTILKTARSKEFMQKEGRKKAYDNLQERGIDSLVIIGGDGSFKGANTFSKEYNIPCIGIPATIDKDIPGTDLTIGFDTACNTAIAGIDKIRDTADSHDRLFIIEVMGRDAGYLALYSGIATGAENILIPERKTNINSIVKSLEEKEKRKKLVNIIVVAEGSEYGDVNHLAKVLSEKLPAMEIRVSILGHIQRGGSPNCMDRLIASRLGYQAVECLKDGKYNLSVGITNNKMSYTPLDEIATKKQHISEDWIKIGKILSS